MQVFNRLLSDPDMDVCHDTQTLPKIEPLEAHSDIASASKTSKTAAS